MSEYTAFIGRHDRGVEVKRCYAMAYRAFIVRKEHASQCEALIRFLEPHVDTLFAQVQAQVQAAAQLEPGLGVIS